ncbi:prepilin-type N-terminal cleavage/methylation domain-containing protein [Candidatus Roizmanbacteria bacterium]|nr:prepilin-type N-terminal cleavage/methylation domain-containing protein [Candidatus Roizmanbacteria bacterium]
MKKKNYSQGMTLVEILIVIAMLVVIAVASLAILNPLGQLNKARDGERKADLSKLNKMLEEWYNDKQYYPDPSDLCYDTPVLYMNTQSCHICGRESTSPPSLSSYGNIPCDPAHPDHKYLYVVSRTTNNWYKIYSVLTNHQDQQSVQLGCAFKGCGIPDSELLSNSEVPFGYDLGISSPNIDLDRAARYQCVGGDGKCNDCGTYNMCITNHYCHDNKFYSSRMACQQDGNR